MKGIFFLIIIDSNRFVPFNGMLSEKQLQWLDDSLKQSEEAGVGILNINIFIKIGKSDNIIACTNLPWLNTRS